ncbi:Hypothetical predicted protein [Lecanosticta acicola]|uniref:Uncharacterized protein n=1 Tax=Lecanosticta acicola TaxID=111012 RepID=A0AAI8Z8V0_9PEZI|nr:Hypothetical predicted protein [Lecanosticta acicola]
MAPHRWSDYERHVLHIGYGEFNLSNAEMENVFRHLCAANWPNGTPAGRRLGDEWNTRNHPTRAARWRDYIDRPSYNAAQQAERAQVRNDIITARVQVRQTQGSTALPAATAPAAPPALVPAPANPQPPATAPTTSTSTSVGAPVVPVTPSESSESDNENEQGHHPSYQPLQQTRPLSMIHSCEIWHSGQIPHYNPLQGVGAIAQGTRLYRCGGPVQRVFFQNHFDIMTCWKDTCTYCGGPANEDQQAKLDAARAAENNRNINIDASPYQGLPFIHGGRDTQTDEEYTRWFKPGGTPTAVPEDTLRANIVFDNRQQQPFGGECGLRRTLICDRALCDVCLDWEQQEDAALDAEIADARSDL